MPGYTIQEFRKVPYFHFLFCAALFGCFAAGFLNTQETAFEREIEDDDGTKNGTAGETEGVIRYYIFGAVGGGLHFLLIVLSCVVNDMTSAKEKYQSAQGWIGFYRFLLLPFIPYCVVGAIMTGINGICVDFEECIYQENQVENLCIAIGITVLHGLSFLLTLFLMSRSSKTETEIKALNKPAPKPAAKKTDAESTTTPPKPPQPSGPPKRPISAPSAKSKSDPPKPESKKPDAEKQPASSKRITFTQDIPPPPHQNGHSSQKKLDRDIKTGQSLKSVTVTLELEKTERDKLAHVDDEEEALRWLRRQQLEEAMRNAQKQPEIRFTDDGRPYTPVFLPAPMPSPPSYEQAISGAYPSDDPLRPRVLTADDDDTSLWSPGPELEKSIYYNSEISSQYMQDSSGLPPDPKTLLVHPYQVSYH